MFIKFHKMKEERDERGFTLIELLVVILIIAILAAIAIPAFLNQRKKGWESQSKSSLKNAATAMESYATGTAGDYSAATSASLTSEGFNPTSGVAVTIVTANTDSDEYCLQADHTQAAVDLYYYDSDVGEPTTTACTSN